MAFNLKINTSIKTPSDFNDLHDSRHILKEVRNNQEIAKQLAKSAKLIDKYINKFVDTFIFNNKTIDKYLSLVDVEIICKNDKFLHEYWTNGLTMSQVLLNFQESEYYKTIPVDTGGIINFGGYGWHETKFKHNYKDHHYYFTNYFIDIINKKIYFIDPEDIIINHKENIVDVTHYTEVTKWGHYKSDRVYPTWNSSKGQYCNMHIKIDLGTNQIIQSANEYIRTEQEIKEWENRYKTHKRF